MAKNKNGRNVAKKKYSAKERYDFHTDRYFSCGKYGIGFGSPKHCYSTGFRDAFYAHDNTSAITREFGANTGKAYQRGYKRGTSAAKEYFLTTGKQPADIHRS